MSMLGAAIGLAAGVFIGGLWLALIAIRMMRKVVGG